ncbi:MAG: TM2 domain-containing protein [Cyanobacteria bacterium REEB65]|nr:TM2 domain-containing protein [Cyanobacteria bacterium REEB65]
MPDSSPDRKTAALLAILLGDFGIHKFYLGKNRQGLLYLILCWTFVPGVVSLFEGLAYMLMSDRTFTRRLGRPLTPSSTD